MSITRKAKDAFNHLSGKDLKKLRSKGINQQKLVNDLDENLNWVQKNITYRGDVKSQQKKLKDLDEIYDAKKKKLLYDRVTAGGGLGVLAIGADAYQSREKRASSRLLNLLKGTRQKSIKRRMKTIEGKMSKADKTPGTSQKTFTALDENYEALQKENLKERVKRTGTYLGLGALPVVGAKQYMNKESKYLPLKAVGALTAGGGAIGAGINLADKEIENTSSNISQSALLGAVAAGVPSLAGVLAFKNPRVRKALNKMMVKAKK